MNADRQKAIVLELLKAMKREHSWCGETHLQKSLYFLQEGLGVPTAFAYVLYKHGPYSFELHQLLGEMRANMLLDLEPRPYPYGPSITATLYGERLMSVFPKTLAGCERQIAFVAKNISGADVSELERMSTALFVLKEQSDESDDLIARKITNIKPHINEDDALQFTQRVRALLKSAP
jgi:uncharacterized protein YwgA